jgi:hypothetical protein
MMTIDKVLIQKSIGSLSDTAQECDQVARAQREGADKQHASAHKLELLSRTLKVDAAELRDDLKAAAKLESKKRALF